MLKALPEEMRAEALASRATSSVDLVYRVLKKYQPGGLGERTHLLKQLVEARTPGSVQEIRLCGACFPMEGGGRQIRFGVLHTLGAT